MAMSTVRASRKFMHSTSSPAANFCFIELVIYASIAPHPNPLPASGAREKGRGFPLPACGERVRGSSAAGDGVNVANTVRQASLAPRLATILCPEHLAKARDAVDLVGIARMHCNAHHRRLGFDAVVEAFPSLADILAAVDRPVGAARRRAEAGIHDLR